MNVFIAVIKHMIIYISVLLLLFSCGEKSYVHPFFSTSIISQTNTFDDFSEANVTSSDTIIFDQANGQFQLTTPGSTAYPDNEQSNSWVDMSGNILLMHLDGTTGVISNGTSITDSSGNNNNGTINDINNTVNYTSGRINNGIEFDGINDYIEVPYSASVDLTGTELSVAAWMYIPSAARPIADRAVVCKGDTISVEHYMIGIDNTDTYNFRTNTANGFSRMDVGSIIYDEWHLLIGTYDGSNMRLYLNGQKVGDIPQTGNLLSDPDPLYIGKRCAGSVSVFPGSIDEVSVWSRALSQAEITNIYNNQMQVEGTIYSQVFDAKTLVNWSTISWETQFPVQKELPNSTQSESSYTTDNVLMNGNILLLHLNENSWNGSAEEVIDSSGNNWHAKSSGLATTTTDGKFNGAANFNGTTNYLELDHNDDFLVNNGTVSLWFKAIAFGTDYVLFSKDSSGFDTGGHITIGIELTGQLDFRLQSTTAHNSALSSTYLFADRWYHVTAVFGSNQGMKIYVNGVLTGTNAYAGGTDDVAGGNHEPLVIGAGTRISDDLAVTPMNNFFNGNIDEVAIWNRDLSTTEVLALYKRGVTRLNIKVRSCDNSTCSGFDFIGPDGLTSSDYSELDNSTVNLPSFNITNLSPSRFFQYMVTMDTENNNYSPLLKNVSVTSGP